MGYMNGHQTWFKRLTNDATERAAALAAGITTSTINRQLAKGELSADNVIKLCRAYSHSPVQGLAATGHLTQEEATGISTTAAAELLSDPELIRTLAYRINADPEAWFGTFGELTNEDSNIAGGVVHSLPYAADSSDTEPEEGDDDYPDGP